MVEEELLNCCRAVQVFAFAMFRVRAEDESDRPAPRRLLKDDPLTMRLVVDAVMNDE